VVGVKFKELEGKYKIIAMVALLATACWLTYYFHTVVKAETIYTHFFYVPTILAALWWKRKGLWVAIFLAAVLIVSHITLRPDVSVVGDCFRAGIFIGIALVVAVLSERMVKMGEELRETHGYLDKLLSHANVPTIVWDTASRITRFNLAFERLTGYTAMEVIGRELQMLLPEASEDESLRKIARTSGGENWESVEIPILRKDGKTCLALWNSANIYDKDGKTLLATIAQGQDITERKRMEEALRESEERYRSLIHNIPDVVWTSDENYRTVFVSPNVERLTGYTQEEEYQCGDWIKWFDRVHADDIEHAKTAFKELFREGKLYDIEYRFRRKDGQWIWISDRSVGTYKKEEELYASGLFSDITERKQMEEDLWKHHERLEELVEERTKELKDAQERLLAAERLATLGEFSGSISHELRNPLSVIDSSAYYLKTKLKDADEKVLEHLNRIKSSVGSSTATIESLLNLTRMKEPKLTMVDLIAITSDAIATSKVPDTVKVIQDFPGQEVWVNADHEQLRMAFNNIIKNASEALEGKGTLTVTVRTAADSRAEVSFTDTGQGIAEENLDRVFQPLFSTKTRGIGFGLSIAKMVIDKHGGTIEAKSEPGKGATITIQLPQYPDKDREVK